MVCVYCGGVTGVINSRHQKRSNQVWRRRSCARCEATFTTEETPVYELAWVVWRGDGSFRPFSRDRLLLSLYRACEHRPQALRDAQGLVQTIIRKLPASVMSGSTGTLHHHQIARLALVALTRFDRAAAVRYQALHRRSLRSAAE